MSESAGLVHIESHPLINELERVIYIIRGEACEECGAGKRPSILALKSRAVVTPVVTPAGKSEAKIGGARSESVGTSDFGPFFVRDEEPVRSIPASPTSLNF
jgi:hypothetical protein